MYNSSYQYYTNIEFNNNEFNATEYRNFMLIWNCKDT